MTIINKQPSLTYNRLEGTIIRASLEPKFSHQASYSRCQHLLLGDDAPLLSLGVISNFWICSEHI